MEQDATLVEPFTREDVMKRTVPWRNYAEAGLITAKDLELITEFDKKEPDVQQDMLSNVCVLNTLVLSFFLTDTIITFFTTGEEGQKVRDAAVHGARQNQHCRAAAVRRGIAERACRWFHRPRARSLHRGQQDHGYLHSSLLVCSILFSFSTSFTFSLISFTVQSAASIRIGS